MRCQRVEPSPVLSSAQPEHSAGRGARAGKMEANCSNRDLLILRGRTGLLLRRQISV